MSADNGIYVLQDGDNYWVAHVQAIDSFDYCLEHDGESVEWDPEDEISFDGYVKSVWGESQHFTQANEAHAEAFRQLSELDVCEYGICVIQWPEGRVNPLLT